MTKEQKILLLFVLAIAASSATFYVVNQKDVEAVNQNQVSTTNTAENATQNNNNTESPAAQTPVAQQPVSKEEVKVVTNKTITENVTYKVPNNFSDEITVVAVIDNSGTIVDVTFSYATPSNKESKEYLEKFNRSFSKNLVVGKKVGAVNLSRVGGASLTTGAFNNAFSNISTKFNG